MRYRTIVIPVLGALLVLGGYLVFGNLNRNLVYYLEPTEAVAQKADFGDGERFRLGGLVDDGSVVRTAEGVRFTVVDSGGAVSVVHAGAPPQLFAAGIGVVVEGSWRDSTFYSDTMIVKHDENYRAPQSATGDPVDRSSR